MKSNIPLLKAAIFFVLYLFGTLALGLDLWAVLYGYAVGTLVWVFI